MKLTLTHRLTFSLGAPPPRAVYHLLLTALATPQQKVERWSIDMPGFAEAPTCRDGFGNKAHLVSQVKPGEEINVTVSGVVETIDRAGVLGRLDYDPAPALFRRVTATTRPDPALVEGLPRTGGRIAVMHELMGRLAERGQAMSQSQDGAAQKSAMPNPGALALAFVGAARSQGIPARYVTGYLLEESASTFHAWAEAWDDGLGWIGFDPTLDVCPTDQHVRLASGLDATSALPIRSVPALADMAQTVEIVAA